MEQLSDDRPWHGGKILVAEDNYLLGEVVCDLLLDCGLEPVGPAFRLEEAKELARYRALDGAVLDLKLGEHLCFPVCTILMAREIPFIFLTGYRASSAIPMEFRKAPLISKPFAIAEMKSALVAMLKLGESPATPSALGLHSKG